MRVARSAAVLLLVGAVSAGCGSAGGSADDADPGLLVDATVASGGDCPGADVLVSLLASTGVTYDYQPTDGPRELALAVDAVVRGRLTGRVEPVVGDRGPAIDLGVDVQELVLGEQLAGMTPPLSRLRLTVSPAELPGSATTVAALEGVEVVAFVTTTPHGDDDAGDVGVPAAMEGLMATCGGEGLVGWHGDGPGWDLPDLGAVTFGALGLPDTVSALEGVWQAGGDGPSLEVARGPEHCDLESTVIAGGGSYDRMFVRDPEGVITQGLVGTLELAAPPPDGRLSVVWEDAGRSPVRLALVQGEDGLAVDLGDGRWERWPEAVPAFGCA